VLDVFAHGRERARVVQGQGQLEPGDLLGQPGGLEKGPERGRGHGESPGHGQAHAVFDLAQVGALAAHLVHHGRGHGGQGQDKGRAVGPAPGGHKPLDLLPNALHQGAQNRQGTPGQALEGRIMRRAWNTARLDWERT
jgi:hypothetical protein